MLYIYKKEYFSLKDRRGQPFSALGYAFNNKLFYNKVERWSANKK